MKLFNKTQNKLISDNLKKAVSFYDRSKGLIPYEKKDAPVLFFKTHFGIHTFGMKFPLTIIICDKNLIVKKIKTNLKPNRSFFWNPIYENVFELPSSNNIPNLKDKLLIK